MKRKRDIENKSKPKPRILIPPGMEGENYAPIHIEQNHFEAFLEQLPSETSWTRYCQAQNLLGNKGALSINIKLQIVDKEIQRADFSQNLLQSSEFSNVIMQDVVLKETSFMGTKFKDVKIINADAPKIKLFMTEFEGGSLAYSDAGASDCSCAKFNEVNFSGTNFVGAHFQDTQMEGCIFDDAILIGANEIDLDNPMFDKAVKTTEQLFEKIEAGIPESHAYAYRTALEAIINQPGREKALLAQQSTPVSRSIARRSAQLQKGISSEFEGLFSFPKISQPEPTPMDIFELGTEKWVEYRKEDSSEETKKAAEEALQLLKKQHPYASLSYEERRIKAAAQAVPAMGYVVYGDLADLQGLPNELRTYIASFVPGTELSAHEAQKLTYAVARNRLLIPEKEIVASGDKSKLPEENKKNRETLRSTISDLLHSCKTDTSSHAEREQKRPRVTPQEGNGLG